MRLFVRSITVCGFMLIFGALFISGRADSADTVKSLLGEADQPVQQEMATPSPLAEEEPPTLPDKLTHDFNMAREWIRLFECILLATFALIALVVVLRYLQKEPGCSTAQMVNASGLVFIIFGTLFLILLADVDQQLNAGVGILGAVAGYLFGTMRKMEPEGKPGPEKK